MTARQKATAVTVLWISLGVTMIWSARAPWLRVLLVLIGAAVTVHVVRLPAFRPLPSVDRGTAG
jgi:uncharacterized membrane protein YbaN (DUF454 family)